MDDGLKKAMEIDKAQEALQEINAHERECALRYERIEERLGVVERVEHKPEYYQAVNIEDTIQELPPDSEGC